MIIKKNTDIHSKQKKKKKKSSELIKFKHAQKLQYSLRDYFKTCLSFLKIELFLFIHEQDTV